MSLSHTCMVVHCTTGSRCTYIQVSMLELHYTYLLYIGPSVQWFHCTHFPCTYVPRQIPLYNNFAVYTRSNAFGCHSTHFHCIQVPLHTYSTLYNKLHIGSTVHRWQVSKYSQQPGSPLSAPVSSRWQVWRRCVIPEQNVVSINLTVSVKY